ncbi:MAG: hypothetical protein LRZ99_07115 [Desulfotomaculum sp.]|nr:hypothetical protein [Desulfotomaculum sp.]
MNQYIDQIANQKNRLSPDLNLKQQDVELEYQTKIIAGKLAWLAAAEIAKRKGYPLAATLIQYSVINKNYYRSGNSDFATAIRNSDAYANYIDDFVNKVNTNDIRFTRSDNSDLFFALHRAKFSVELNNKTFGNYRGIDVALYDLYDFKPSHYDSIFIGAVTNWAWLSQQTFLLHEIDVNIKFEDYVLL